MKQLIFLILTFISLCIFPATSLARFGQADEWEGDDTRPISLNKYLYAEANPVNNIDPSGLFAISSLSTATHLRSTLAGSQLDFGLNVFDSVHSGGDSDQFVINTAIGVGAGAGIVALGSAGFKLVKRFSRGRTAKLILKLDERTIRRQLKYSPYMTTQEAVSITKIQNFASQMLEGKKFRPIRLEDNIITDGHHRYIASQIVGIDIGVSPFPGVTSFSARNKPKKSLTELSFY